MAKANLFDRIKKQQDNRFVGRAEQIEGFTKNFERIEPTLIFNLHGIGGVGKTFLSKKFMAIAEGRDCLNLYTDESIKSLLDWMENISAQCKAQGVELKDFDKRYKAYQQETKQLEADPEKPKGMLGGIARTVSRGLFKEAKKLPGAELFSEFVDTDSASNVLGEWADFVYKKLSNKDEVELVLHPVKVLSPLFWKNLSEQTEDKKFVCFFIDTFEETNAYLETWFLDVLQQKHGKDIPANLLLVIAGRDALDPNAWSFLGGLVERLPLEPFTEEEAHVYMHKNGITDNALRSDILHLSGHLPVLVAWLVETAKDNPTDLQDACETAVERFLKWIKNSDLRDISLALALPRAFNQDTVTALLGDKHSKTKEVFDWVLTQPIVQKKGNRWAYHTVVRDLMLRYLRTRSKKDWDNRQQLLSDTYAAWQQEMGLQEAEQYSHAEWLRLEQEWRYHALCAKPDAQLPEMVAKIIKVTYKKGINSAMSWINTLKEAGTDADHSMCKGWGLRLLTGFEAFNKDNKSGALQGVFEDILQKNFVKELVYKSIMHTEVGNAYANKGDYDGAISAYEKALEIKPDYANAYGSLGFAYLISGKIDQAEMPLKNAIELGDFDTGNMNLGHVHLVRGEEDTALACYQKGLAAFFDADEFWAGMEEDFKHLVQYGISREYYDEILVRLKAGAGGATG